MTELPRFLRRAPQILYVTALIVFAAEFALNIVEMQQTTAYTVAGDPLVTIAKLRVILTALLNAIFIASNGLLIHALLAIWDQLAVAKPSIGDDK